jgi:hypothetical protein
MLHFGKKKNLLKFCSCPESLYEAKFKGDRLVYLAEEIQRQVSLQVVAWEFLASFSQIYDDNHE